MQDNDSHYFPTRQHLKNIKSQRKARVQILYENDNHDYENTEEKLKQLNYDYKSNKNINDIKIEEKLRKLRRRIRSISSTQDQLDREKKEQEALNLIEEILKNTKRNKTRHQKYQDHSDSNVNKNVVKINENNLRKFIKSTASKKESYLPIKADLPKQNLEEEFNFDVGGGGDDDDDSFMQTPMITGKNLK